MSGDSDMMSGDKRKPNDYVVCGAIFDKLGAQQCHMRLKVEYDAAVPPTSGV